ALLCHVLSGPLKVWPSGVRSQLCLGSGSSSFQPAPQADLMPSRVLASRPSDSMSSSLISLAVAPNSSAAWALFMLSLSGGTGAPLSRSTYSCSGPKPCSPPLVVGCSPVPPDSVSSGPVVVPASVAVCPTGAAPLQATGASTRGHARVVVVVRIMRALDPRR